MLRRRLLLGAVVGALLAAPLAASAQAPGAPAGAADPAAAPDATRTATPDQRTTLVGPRIIGGTLAGAGSWPSQAALISAGVEPEIGQFCGGTLIRERWVLTAAHCVNASAPSSLDVAIGINGLDDITPSDRIGVTSIRIHPDWDATTSEWDFALLELARASAAPTMALITADQEALTDGGRPAGVAGWGCIVRGPCDTGAEYPIDLREATMAFVTDGACTTEWGVLFDPVSMVCAGGSDSGAPDTCAGDSGGPLVADADPATGAIEPVLAGLTSWGADPCAEPGAPGVYARVTAGLAWISSVVGDATISGAIRVPDGGGFTATGLCVTLTDDHGGHIDDAVTTGGGAYSFTELAAGTYAIAVSAGPGCSDQNLAPGSLSGIAVTAGQASSGNGLLLAAGATIAGTLSVPAGYRAAGICVYADSGSGGHGWAATGAGGAYAITRLPAGTYTITTDAGAECTDMPQSLAAGSRSGVTVATGQTSSGNDIALASSAPAPSPAPQQSSAPAAPATPRPAAARGPAAPAVRWAPPSPTGEVVARFAAAPGTTYSITAATKGKKATKGSCKSGKGRVSCRIRLTPGRWVVTVTPKRDGVVGTPARRTVTIAGKKA